MYFLTKSMEKGARLTFECLQFVNTFLRYRNTKFQSAPNVLKIVKCREDTDTFDTLLTENKNIQYRERYSMSKI